MEENRKNSVDYRAVIREISKRRKIYFIVLPVAFVLSCLYIMSIPRLYFSETKVAPELENPANGGALSTLASSFGFDLSEMQSSDALHKGFHHKFRCGFPTDFRTGGKYSVHLN